MSLFAGPSRDGGTGSTVTYRHLLSPQAMTVYNPLRTIAHCDIDGAFAQFEQVRLGLPDEVPLICIQWNSIIAVNYPARAFGIKRFTSIADAKKLCPHLVVAHVATFREGDAEPGYWEDADRRTHKVSLDPYRRESLKILAIFREMAPVGELEKASIDEAFMDLTPMVIRRLLETFPYLGQPPDDTQEGLDTPLPPPPAIDWSKSGNVLPIVRDEEGGEEGADPEYGPIDESEYDATWEDWALCIGAEIMEKTRAEVFKRLHYTCSAGIAHNKPMAKLCSAWKKPNAQTVLRLAATPGFLKVLDFQDIRFLGGKLGSAMAEEFNAKTVGDMLKITLETMQAKFGEESIWVYKLLRGIDHTEVKEKLVTKSMLASKNTIPNVRTHAQAHHWLLVLASELAARLREGRESLPGLWPKTIVLGTRAQNEAFHSRQAPFPFSRNLTAEHILKIAKRLWEEQTAKLKPGSMRFSNISLTFTGLEQLEEGQRGIEGFFATKPKDDTPKSPKRSRPPSPRGEAEGSSKKPRLGTLYVGGARANGGIKEFLSPKAGPGSEPCSTDLTDADQKENADFSEVVSNSKGDNSNRSTPPSNPSTKPNAPTSNESQSNPNDQDQDANITPREDITESRTNDPHSPDHSEQWRCPKCNTILRVPPETPPYEAEEWIQAARQEHEDYHFALALQEEYGVSSGGVRSGSGRSSDAGVSGGGESRAGGRTGESAGTKGTGAGGTGKRTRPGKKGAGIKAFFAPVRRESS